MPHLAVAPGWIEQKDIPMKDEPRVWATQFMNRPSYLHSVCADGVPDWREFHRAYDQTLPFDRSNVPTRLLVKHYPKPSTDVFSIEGGVMVVSEKLAGIISNFDLGPAPTETDPHPSRAELLPLPLFDKGGTKKIANVCMLQVSSHKDGWIPEESSTRQYHAHRDLFSMTVAPLSLGFNRSAQGTGADLWRDRRASDVIFLSDRLYRAMQDAGIEKLDEFHPCRMIDDM